MFPNLISTLHYVLWQIWIKTDLKVCNSSITISAHNWPIRSFLMISHRGNNNKVAKITWNQTNSSLNYSVGCSRISYICRKTKLVTYATFSATNMTIFQEFWRFWMSNSYLQLQVIEALYCLDLQFTRCMALIIPSYSNNDGLFYHFKSKLRKVIFFHVFSRIANWRCSKH